jgi:hypothetical protein
VPRKKDVNFSSVEFFGVTHVQNAGQFLQIFAHYCRILPIT